MTAVKLATLRHNADGSVTEGSITVDPDKAPQHKRPQRPAPYTGPMLSGDPPTDDPKVKNALWVDKQGRLMVSSG